jgi:hypothetical protein
LGQRVDIHGRKRLVLKPFYELGGSCGILLIWLGGFGVGEVSGGLLGGTLGSWP